MRFILLVSFVFASQVFCRNEPGLLDGLLGDRNDGLLGGMLGGGHRNRDLLGDGGLLGTGIGGSRGLLGTGLLGNDGLSSRHRGRHYRHHDYYGDNDYHGYSFYHRKPSKHFYKDHYEYSKPVHNSKPFVNYNKNPATNYEMPSNEYIQKITAEATKKPVVITKPKVNSPEIVSNETSKKITDDHAMKKPAQYP